LRPNAFAAQAGRLHPGPRFSPAPEGGEKVIVVKVELHSAVTGKVEEIGRTIIFNRGTGTKTHGDYEVNLMRRGTKSTVLRAGRIEQHPRLAQPVWALVKKALAAVGF
jgi:hypothetical protein